MRIVILRATYGAKQTHRDVTQVVQNRVKNGRLEIMADSRDLGGDPAFGEIKTLQLRYALNGIPLEKQYREGERVSLP
jgi:hypothetical protein